MTSRYEVDKDERVVTRADTLVKDGSTVSRPSGVVPELESIILIDGVQSNNPAFIAETAIVRLKQTPHDVVNGQVVLETFSFADTENDFYDVPTSRFAMDHIAARKLINELAKMLDIDLQSQRKNRGYLGKKQ